MLYLNTYEVSDGVSEITITYKDNKLDAAMLQHVIDYILDRYNDNTNHQFRSIVDE